VLEQDKCNERIGCNEHRRSGTPEGAVLSSRWFRTEEVGARIEDKAQAIRDVGLVVRVLVGGF
jgi:hypothetical protein